MTASNFTHTPNITNMLAIEMFKRMSGSLATGMIGVAIMLYPHWDSSQWQRPVSWSIVMLAVYYIRSKYARRGLRVAMNGQDPTWFINLQALLCGLTGIGWASALYVFDTGTMDQKFDLRFMILAAAFTFPLSSLSAFKRVFFSYFTGITVPVLLFIMTESYARQWNVLFPSSAFYIAMIAMISLSANRQIRQAKMDNLQVLALSEKLQKALEAETQLRIELGFRADTDDLTGIFNRRGLLAQLKLELARCRRFAHCVAVLMIDIDHFKEVNDTYGHASGDTTIIAMVETIKKQLRETDIFGRLGGEEFLLILPAMDIDGAQVVAERIRECIANTAVALPQRMISITVSIGVAIYSEHDDSDRLLARADAALYSAKHHGRNRVEVETQFTAHNEAQGL
jgi:diguanylate cyclase (GGDEF)-like protein